MLFCSFSFSNRNAGLAISFFFSSRRRHTRCGRDWSSDVCSSDLRGGNWQLAIAAGVFSQFDMSSRTADLMNTDYLVGLPVTYQRGAVTTRFRLYHQSSHLGDEYMAHTQAHRVDLTFEAAELLVSGDVGAWRLYGGGEYVLAHSPR